MASAGQTSNPVGGATNRATLLVDPSRNSRTSDSSSDDGYRMSPAAARAFARRNMRRTSPTPDLVTSLVRPPSPDSYYNAGQAQPISNRATTNGRGARTRTSSGRPLTGPAARRAGPQISPHQSSLDIPAKYGGDAIFDMYALNYVAEPDSALMCPICHDPLVDPITTPCDHTFCYRCLRRSIASSPSGTACPVDREALMWTDCFSSGRLIRTQLNNLMVKCPFRGRGCNQELRRENVEAHITTECRFREYTCGDAECDKKLRRKPLSSECEHVTVDCRYCEEDILEPDKDVHLISCPKAKTRCETCWQLVLRSTMSAHHDLDCDGIEVACTYQDLGCPIRIERGELAEHLSECPFHPETASGMVIRSQRDLIQSYTDLTEQIRECRTQQEGNNERLREISAAVNRQPNGEPINSDNRTIQDLDAGFEEVHQNLTHLEARQSMWTLNQVMPIREEVTELRNNINMIRMHVNWLLNRSREEGRIRAANNSGSSGTIRRESSEGAPSMTMLPERRRSSGADTDLPRL